MILGRAVKAISSLGVRSLWLYICNFIKDLTTLCKPSRKSNNTLRMDSVNFEVKWTLHIWIVNLVVRYPDRTAQSITQSLMTTIKNRLKLLETGHSVSFNCCNQYLLFLNFLSFRKLFKLLLSMSFLKFHLIFKCNYTSQWWVDFEFELTWDCL